MRITLLLFFLSLSLLNAYGQDQGNILLTNFTPSQCDKNEDPYRIRMRIVDQGFEGDTFRIEVGTVATCCVDFVPSIQFSNDTLNLRFEETGIFCECSCCYQFVYRITGLKGRDFKVKLQGVDIKLSEEKYITYPVKYDLYNGDTINYVDKHSFRQGLHISGKDRSRPSKRMIYHDNEPYSGSRRIRYYDNGNKKSEILVDSGKEVSVEYYLSGQQKEECREFRVSLTKYSLKFVTLCNVWDSLGNKLQSMDCCLLDDTGKYGSVIYAFKSKSENKIYVNQEVIVNEAELEKINEIQFDKSKKTLFCYEKGTTPEFVRKVLEYLKGNGIVLLEINEFEEAG